MALRWESRLLESIAVGSTDGDVCHRRQTYSANDVKGVFWGVGGGGGRSILIS